MRRITSEEAAAWALGAPLAVWGAALLAPAIEGGEGSFLARAAAALSDPAAVTLTASTPKVVLVAVALYLLAAAVWWSARRNWRRREEHGSAQWGSPSAIDRKYRQKPFEDNLILTRHFLHAHRTETKLLIRAAKLADDRVFREDHVVAIQNAERFIAYKGFCAQDCIRQALCLLLADKINVRQVRNRLELLIDMLLGGVVFEVRLQFKGMVKMIFYDALAVLREVRRA